MVRTELDIEPTLARRIEGIFGQSTDPMPLLEQRALAQMPDRPVIVWEGDATTFEFGFVSRSAEVILGYPVADWLVPGFWTGVVVHEDDRDDAVAYCALATGRGADHDFTYRAVGADGRIHLFHDIVRVVLGRKGVAERLRGLMIDVTEAADAI